MERRALASRGGDWGKKNHAIVAPREKAVVRLLDGKKSGFFEGVRFPGQSSSSGVGGVR
jgi:hypothetical protein